MSKDPFEGSSIKPEVVRSTLLTGARENTFIENIELSIELFAFKTVTTKTLRILVAFGSQTEN